MLKLDDYTAIIFDFGGILINLDYNKTIDAFKKLGIDDFEAMYSQASQTGLFDDIETGKITPQLFINKLLDYLPKGTSPNSVVAAWNNMLMDIPAHRIDFLIRLRAAGKKIFLLSNTNEIHIDYALRRWKESHPQMPTDIFNGVYYSHNVGMRKPNEEIFEFVCKENQLDKSTTLFIDDSIQHVEGAKRAGLNAFLMKSNQEIESLFS